MQISESIINNLLIEVDSLTYRIRNIKQCLNTTLNNRLRERLVDENQLIYKRINEINKTAKLFDKNEKISYTTLLLEKCKRSLDEAKTEKKLFYF